MNDSYYRAAAFDWLAQQTAIHGQSLPRDVLAKGLVVGAQQLRLIGPQGIFKPQQFDLPLSITTAPNSPYPDYFDKNGQLLYRYRGDNPQHHENVGLRMAMQQRVPLVYFYGLVPGRYLPTWPVFIVADRPDLLTFTVEIEAQAPIASDVAELGRDPHRAYAIIEVRHRLHQEAFRERVLRAYQEQCAVCRLRHRELLDATHIIPDADPEGEPRTTNGLALCKLHHAAFDALFIGIRADYVIEVRHDLLEESDGPMLLHGLQGIHHTRLHVPRVREWMPDPHLLQSRFLRFQAGP